MAQRLTAQEAKDIMNRCGISQFDDYFSIPPASINELLNYAKDRGYRPSPGAGRSIPRAFHGYLLRTARSAS